MATAGLLSEMQMFSGTSIHERLRNSLTNVIYIFHAYLFSDDKKPAAAIRQDTLYDEPWDSNMISVVIDSVINHHQAHQRETEHLSQVLEEENRGEV